MNEIAKWLIISGCALIGIGLCFAVFGKIPWLGRLPGDIAIKKDSFQFYFPLTTCIILSILLSVILHFFGRK